MTLAEQKKKALDIATRYAGIDGARHKMWVIDQMIRALTDCPVAARDAVDCNGVAYSYEAQGESVEYLEFLREYSEGEDGPSTYQWDTGIAP